MNRPTFKDLILLMLLVTAILEAVAIPFLYWWAHPGESQMQVFHACWKPILTGIGLWIIAKLIDVKWRST